MHCFPPANTFVYHLILGPLRLFFHLPVVQAGNKDEGLIFLLTDSQITNERFLIYINDLLASGNIPDLFAVDEVDGIVSAIFQHNQILEVRRILNLALPTNTSKNFRSQNSICTFSEGLTCV